MRKSIVVKTLMALIFAFVISGISAGTVLGKYDHRGRGPQQRGCKTIMAANVSAL